MHPWAPGLKPGTRQHWSIVLCPWTKSFRNPTSFHYLGGATTRELRRSEEAPTSQLSCQIVTSTTASPNCSVARSSSDQSRGVMAGWAARSVAGGPVNHLSQQIRVAAVTGVLLDEV